MTAIQDTPELEAVCCAPLIREPLADGQARDLATMFKALADPARLRLLSIIASHQGGEACVCDLTEPVDLSQPTVSHHLKILTDAGLLTRDKRGKWAYYAVVPQALDTLGEVLRVEHQASGPASCC
ncbi:metalloregulator ArsR/SmtB family transcription factor [Georgenia satyanarayanai]|uniref:ArsR/SmtB family transcription factor n=1 Tax=Georgenia satyanarayanai TaxID=860221 RepID=UPI00203C6829|nr:metalloregulator ArsR/SmtB family transcription factor [Georgenia satyanarayanai]MCM3660469.1 metalloregulator ArsR/SmtB family transcription factor [Georgenia satyanarayanai]HLS74327.1 metalloregulator ArsR/SmtB family transcription factor [Actinomycetaceae bacterium]